MRPGFTLLEILIVIMLISFASVSLVTSFGDSQERVEFQQNVNAISSTIAAARSSALSDDVNSDAKRIVMYNQASNKITAFVDLNDNQKPDIVDANPSELIAEAAFGETLNISKTLVMTDEIDSVDSKGFRITFDPVSNTCDFAFDSSKNAKEDMTMLILLINKAGENEPARYLYFHKKSCLPELLSSSPVAL